MSGRFLAAIIASAILSGACGKGAAGSGPTGGPTTSSPVPASAPVPPVPAEGANLGPGQPPIIWVGGTLEDVAENQIVVQEEPGAVVTLKRLAKGATAFYTASRTRWERLPDGSRFGSGGQVCVETALDGRNLLALRVFLGVACGPAA